MKNISLFALLIGCGLFFSTCHKGEGLFFKCKPENTMKIPPHAMDYFYFKVGTWWVYECEQTKYRDSFFVKTDRIYVDKLEGAKQECNCAWSKCFENGSITIHSNLSDSMGYFEQIVYVFHHYNIDYYSNNPHFGTLEIKEGYEDHTDFPGYRMNYEENSFYNPSGNGGVLSELDTMTVVGHLFTNILEYSYLQSNNGYPDWYKIAWYGKNMHLIRYIKTDGTIWNLIKWNIVQ